MSEYLHVEKPLLNQLLSLGWAVIDQAHRWNSSNRVKVASV
jgi:hypothetical protein